MSANNLELSSLRQRQRVLQMLIFSLVTLMIWIGFSIFRSQSKTNTTKEQTQLAEPLTPTLNQTVLDEIEQKKHYTEEELSSFPIYKLVTSKDGRTETKVPIGTKDEAIESLFAQPTPPPTASSSTQQSTSTESDLGAVMLTGTGETTNSGEIAQ